MKRAYNSMLDAKELPRDQEGLRIYNNHLLLLQQLRKLARLHQREWLRRHRMSAIHGVSQPLMGVSVDSDLSEWRKNQLI